MSKTHLLLVAILTLCSGVLWSQESTKGNWTQADRNEAFTELFKQRDIFETFLDSTQIDPLINCIVDELEATFDNPDSVKTENELTSAISLKCLEEVGFQTEPVSTSIKGNWSKKDKAEIYQNLEYTRRAMYAVMDSSKVDDYFDCLVKKLEAKYNNLTEALKDTEEGISALTAECYEEVGIFSEQENEAEMIKQEQGDPNSHTGNWSDADKALLEEQLRELRPTFEANIGKERTDNLLECVRFNFEHAFENYADVNNHPEVYKAILDECNQKAQ